MRSTGPDSRRKRQKATKSGRTANMRLNDEQKRQQGKSAPLGARAYPEGVNFSIFSKNATAVDLLLFDAVDDPQPARIIPIDPATNRTYHYWHILVPDLKPGQIYGYRVDGPTDPAKGMRFDRTKVLLDPYGRSVLVPNGYCREAASSDGENFATAMKNVVVNPTTYDWEGDTHLRTPSSQTVVYEMHVRGFTRHPNSNVPEEKQGTYAGLIEKVPYLKQLGITAVELMPVFQFDAHDCPQGKTNYWGYAPVSFFAPHHAYSSRKDPLGPLDEFRDMVKALHKAGIEVILDVVFNHTAEGDHTGPTLNFRGLDNTIYYILETNRSRYTNYTGTGNTLNTNNPIVRRMILDSLKYWVREMHIDGFRFDLASILCRDEHGCVMANPPVIWDIESDPLLAGTKFIAEAWDAAGLYQVGNFTGDSWKEWNGKFRDDVRSFFKGEDGSVARLADRLIGSPDLYGHEEREPEQSVNFVTCHDGFTLNDLVTYNEKHNDANGEASRDGTNDNRSWNCGIEGPTDDPKIERLRNQQVKNFLTVTLISIGMPMILMGDEVRRTQCGNNNAYCQDNETTWFDWTLLEKHAGLHRFVTLLNARRTLRIGEKNQIPASLNQIIRQTNNTWHGIRLHHPDWSSHSHSLAFSLKLPKGETLLHMILNAYWEPLDFELPPPNGNNATTWHRWVDTSLDPPHDITEWEEAPPLLSLTYRANARSVAVFYANHH